MEKPNQNPLGHPVDDLYRSCDLLLFELFNMKDETTRVTSSGTDYDEEWSCTEPYVREGLADRLEYCDLRAYSSISGTHTSRLRATFRKSPSPL